MKEMDDRAKDKLRMLIDHACAGVMSHLQLRIKDAASDLSLFTPNGRLCGRRF